MKRKELRKFRRDRDLTQVQMSEKIGVSRAAYQMIESGKHDGKLNFWLNLQKAFGVQDSEMFSLMK